MDVGVMIVPMQPRSTPLSTNIVMIEQLNFFGPGTQAVKDDFESWWIGYPVKRDKKPARRAYLAKRRQGASAEDLIRARDRYLSRARAPYIKYPATFLNVWEEWAEEISPVPESRISNPAPQNATQPVTYVSLCPKCGDLLTYCLCGQVLHTRETPPSDQ